MTRLTLLNIEKSRVCIRAYSDGPIFKNVRHISQDDVLAAAHRDSPSQFVVRTSYCIWILFARANSYGLPIYPTPICIPTRMYGLPNCFSPSIPTEDVPHAAIFLRSPTAADPRAYIRERETQHTQDRFRTFLIGPTYPI